MKLEHNNKCVEITKLKEEIENLQNQTFDMTKIHNRLDIAYTSVQEREIYYKITILTMIFIMFFGTNLMTMALHSLSDNYK